MRSLLRWFGFSLWHLLLALWFCLSLVAGAVLHLDLNVSRRAAAGLLETYLSDSFEGRFELEKVSRLQGGGFAVEGFEVYDPEGRLTLRVGKLSTGIDPSDILMRVFGDMEKLSIAIEQVNAQTVDLIFFPTAKRDDSGNLETHVSLQDAFEPVEEETGTSDDEADSRAVRIWFPSINLRDVHARGSVAGLPAIDVEVQQAKSSLLITDKGTLIDVKRFGLEATGLTDFRTSVSGEFHARIPGEVSGDISGTAEDVPVSAQFRFREGHLDLKGKAPEIEPSAARALVEEWPLDQTISGEFHVFGEAPKLRVEALVRPGPLEQTQEVERLILLEGDIDTEGSAELRVASKSLDLSELDSELPSSDLSSVSRVKARFGKTPLSIEVEGGIKSGSISGTPTPKTSYSIGYNAEELSLDATLEETGIKSRVHASRTKDGPVDFEVFLSESSLGQSERLRPYLSGVQAIVSGTVKGRVDPKVGSITADLDLRGRSVSASEVHTNSLKLVGKIHGNSDAPKDFQGDLAIYATGVNVAGVKLKSLELTHRGKLLSPSIKALAVGEGDIDANLSAKLRYDPLVVEKLSTTVNLPEKPLTIEARRISVTGQHVIVSDFEVASIGRIYGNIDYHPRGGKLDVQAEKLNLTRLTRALLGDDAAVGGDVNGVAKLTFGDRPEGRIELEVEHGSFEGFTNLDFRANTHVSGRDVQGELFIQRDALGTFSSKWDLQLAGKLQSLDSYRNATGTASASLDNVDLKTLSLLFGKSLGLRDTQGHVSLKLEAERKKGDSFPSLSFSGKTADFSTLVVRGEDEVPVGIRGMNANWALGLPASADRIEGALRFEDRRGTFVSVSGELDIPLGKWILSPPTKLERQDTLRDSAINLVVVLPKRNIASYPSFLATPLERGILSARAAVTGTLGEPELSILLDAEKVVGGISGLAAPTHIQANFRYAPRSGALRGNLVAEQNSHRLGSAQLELKAPLEPFIRGHDESTPLWTGEAQLLLESCPLGAFSSNVDAELQGTAQGSIVIRRSKLLPQIGAELHLRRLQAKSQKLGDAGLELQTHGEDLVMRARFVDHVGTLHASAELGVVGTPLFLVAAPNHPIRLGIEAEGYDATVFSPFLSGSLDEFSGILRGKLEAELVPPTEKEGEWRSAIGGNMSFRSGTLFPAALGFRLSEANFDLVAKNEGGKNLIAVENFSATAGEKGQLTASARAYFDNLRLEGGVFELHPKNLPVKNAGALLGHTTGRADGRFETAKDRLKVEVDIDDLTTELVENSESELVELAENPTIEVVQEKLHEKDADAVSEFPIHLKIKLGENVRVKSSILDMRLSGEPRFQIADETIASGSVDLKRSGRFVVLGRSFSVEEGSILFDTDDVADPHIFVISHWTAPNGTQVTLTVRGTASEPILEWSSDPALPGGDADIIALVIGSSGSSSTDGNDGLAAVGALANEALGSSPVSVYATQDAAGSGGSQNLADSNWSTYTAAIQISDELWFEGSYHKENSTGAAAANQRPDFSGTLDWRFHPHWSARTELGTLGVGLDLLWKYRY